MDAIELKHLKQGQALRGIRRSEGFAVLEELIQRKKLDLFQKWASRVKENGRDLSQDWCDGYNSALDELVSGVDELIARGAELDPAEPQQAPIRTILGLGDPAS